MTKEDVLRVLYASVYDDSVIVLAEDDRGRIERAIFIADFLDLFGDAENLTYTELKRCVTAESGWYEILDEWKEKGIIK